MVPKGGLLFSEEKKRGWWGEGFVRETGRRGGKGASITMMYSE